MQDLTFLTRDQTCAPRVESMGSHQLYRQGSSPQNLIYIDRRHISGYLGAGRNSKGHKGKFGRWKI